MANFLVRRTLRSLLTLWIVVTLVFLAFRLAGDPLTILLPEDAPEQTRTFYIEKWQLDEPLPMQYVSYFANILQGNLGQSFINGLDVTDIIAEALPNTLLLGSAAFIAAMLLGISAGVVAALRHNTLIDRVVMIASVAAYSMPDYILGIVLIVVVALELDLLPTSGDDTWQHMVLPLVTLATSSAARIARFARGAMLDVLQEPYLRTARAKGLYHRTVIVRHALRNAAIPVVTILGFQLGFLVAGTAIIESVFAWPGVGRLFIDSVSRRDLPVIQAVVLLIAIGVTAANLLVDILYSIIDPRIRVSGGSG